MKHFAELHSLSNDILQVKTKIKSPTKTRIQQLGVTSNYSFLYQPASLGALGWMTDEAFALVLYMR